MSWGPGTILGDVEKFEVDIADPEAIASALKRVRAEIETKRVEMRELLALRDKLVVLAGETSVDAPPDSERATATSAVVASINAYGGELRPQQVWTMNPGIPPKTIGWALWKAEREGLIKKISQGVYAPLDYEPETLLTAASDALARAAAGGEEGGAVVCGTPGMRGGGPGCLPGSAA
jgi:hypothetical protein